MDFEALREAIDLAAAVGHIFVATSGADGLPHLAAASALTGVADDQVLVTEWFCPGSITNLRDNPRVSLVVWDTGADKGYQLLGEVTEIEDVGVLDGYDPDLESTSPAPQVERRLLVRVGKVIQFTRAPHSDLEG